MTGAGAQLTFAAELAAFLASVAGLAAAAQPEVLSANRRVRGLLALGFALSAAAAFVWGVRADAGDASVPVGALRLAGAALLLAGVPRWRGRRVRALLLLGVVALLVSGVARWVGSVGLGDAGALLGAVALVVALLVAARRSRAVRFSVLTALLVLAVVLAVAVAGSVVVAGNVDDEAEVRYAARAADEAGAARVAARTGLGPARVVAGVLASERATALRRVEARGVEDATAEAAGLEAALADLTDAQLLDLDDPVVLLTASGVPVAAVPESSAAATRVAVAGDPIVVEARRADAERQGVTVVGDRALALSVAPVVARPDGEPQETIGFVVVARLLDDGYLERLGTGGEDLVYALWSPTRAVARSGPLAVDAVVVDDAAAVVASGDARSERDGDAFVALAPVAGPTGRPVLAPGGGRVGRRRGRDARRPVPGAVRRRPGGLAAGDGAGVPVRAPPGSGPAPAHRRRPFVGGRSARHRGRGPAPTTSSACSADRSRRWPRRSTPRPPSCGRRPRRRRRPATGCRP